MSRMVITRQDLEAVSIPCYHCRQAQPGMTAYFNHLITKERYPEEDAGSESGRAAREAVKKADPEYATFLRLFDKFGLD